MRTLDNVRVGNDVTIGAKNDAGATAALTGEKTFFGPEAAFGRCVTGGDEADDCWSRAFDETA